MLSKDGALLRKDFRLASCRPEIEAARAHRG
jgi:hypothetical protein